jgi:hypothetical protein
LLFEAVDTLTQKSASTPHSQGLQRSLSRPDKARSSKVWQLQFTRASLDARLIHVCAENIASQPTANIDLRQSVDQGVWAAPQHMPGGAQQTSIKARQAPRQFFQKAKIPS